MVTESGRRWLWLSKWALPAGLIASLRPELDKLLETSFFLSQQLYGQALRMAGEYEA